MSSYPIEISANRASLTVKQQRFVEEFTTDFNATQAAIRAGYSKHTAAVIGYENLRKPYIAAAIQERLEQFAIGPTEALKLMGDLVRADISQCIEIDEETGSWQIDLNKAKAAGVLPAIQELGFDSGGRPKVKMYDRKDALDKILRAHGAYRMRYEHTGLGGKDLGPFRLEIVNQPQDAGG